MPEECLNCNGTGEVCFSCNLPSYECDCPEFDGDICPDCEGWGEIE